MAKATDLNVIELQLTPDEASALHALLWGVTVAGDNNLTGRFSAIFAALQNAGVDSDEISIPEFTVTVD